ncbi:hypothetical protein SO802_004923 [Lithocarpus litseifolius]|uniref:protein geranylgeranyltransferase type II n=1 Tax=Lithocarpus litseifolius TaxID=425828 RepID=A0AAW2DKF9_9ROSI
MLMVLAVVGLRGAAPPKIRPRVSFVASFDLGQWIGGCRVLCRGGGVLHVVVAGCGSTGHRGTLEYPGRTVTLEPAEVAHLRIDDVLNCQMGGLAAEKHIQYILTVEKRKDDFVSVVMEHLRMSGAYWGLTTLDLLEKLDTVDVDEVVSWVMQCQHESGGFGGNIGHDPHILYTLSAVQVLALFDKLNVLDIDKVTNYVTGLQNEDGSFSGDIWGEVDTRFSYIAICCLSILRRLNKINVEKAVSYIVSCKNLDGGFGCTPGGESHAGQIFCCVAALSLTGSLHHIDKDLLGWWLCERQVKSGGLNGRPEKLPDVCYSWWVLSSLIMIDRVHWITKEKLVKYILDCQDTENGGISDRPDDAVDVYHTYFGIAGLSLLEYPGLKAIDPAYALPVDVKHVIGGLSCLFSSSSSVRSSKSFCSEELKSEELKELSLSSSYGYSSPSKFSGSFLKKDLSPVSVFQGPVSCCTGGSSSVVVGSARGLEVCGDELNVEELTFNIEVEEGNAEPYVKELLLGAQLRHKIFCEDFVVKAFYEAEKAHRGQMRASGDPYMQHCVEMAVMLALIGANSTVVAAGLLHDNLDDTFMNYDYVFGAFGAGVADLVEGVRV